jgi:hypothetical protein
LASQACASASSSGVAPVAMMFAMTTVDPGSHGRPAKLLISRDSLLRDSRGRAVARRSCRRKNRCGRCGCQARRVQQDRT